MSAGGRTVLSVKVGATPSTLDPLGRRLTGPGAPAAHGPSPAGPAAPAPGATGPRQLRSRGTSHAAQGCAVDILPTRKGDDGPLKAVEVELVADLEIVRRPTVTLPA